MGLRFEARVLWGVGEAAVDTPLVLGIAFDYIPTHL